MPLEPLIIFGAALRSDGTPAPALLERVKAALAYGANRTVTYIVTGGVPRNGRTEAAVMAELLMQAGVPTLQIIQENSATDTFDSIIACSRILTRIGATNETPVAMVSSPYHTPRCLLLLRLAGWRTHALPCHSTRRGARFWRSKLRHIAHETLAIPWDTLLVLVWRIVPR
ncbi:MAG: YdcF family protein [Acetobacter syzygii]|uniref:YdcF family protein n=1 Tax=Acetobacter syzygii TaxID=146476 RepID=UPI0039EAE4C0